MGLSIAFAGGITLMAILVMFATIPSMANQIFTGSITNSEINDLNDSILKTKFF